MHTVTNDTAARLADLGVLVASVGIESAPDAVAEVLAIAATFGVVSIAATVLADASQPAVVRERALARLASSIMRHDPANAAYSLMS